MSSGNLVLVLHTHMPYVMGHGSYPHGEHWLYEAAAECYIPMLNILNEIDNSKRNIQITLDISPVLCEQLESANFKDGLIKYLDEKIILSKEDQTNFKKQNYSEEQIKLAEFWQDWYTARKTDFIKKYGKSIIKALKSLQDKGKIEIMTCCATHGYLPLLGFDESCELQVKLGVENYIKHFGRAPRGIWLPECAYRPEYDWKTYYPIKELCEPHKRKGIEQILDKYGLKYFISDEKFIRGLKPLGRFDSFEKNNFVPFSSREFEYQPWNFLNNPLILYNVGSNSDSASEGTAAVFARHKDLSMQVWSGKTGYPADGDYLDFHKKHFPSANRYWRVTDVSEDMEYKLLYDTDAVWLKLDLQTNHYIHHIENTVNFFKNQTGKDATLTLAFDTELFGHWWFEGPTFLKYLLEGLQDSPWINTVSAESAYYNVKPTEVVSIKEGSWGENNDHTVWINEQNKWVWEREYFAEIRFKKLIEKLPTKEMNNTQKRVILQAMKELLLLQSSDWPFLIYTEQARDYAEMRFTNHESDFKQLCDIAEDLIVSGNVQLTNSDLLLLESCEIRDNIFPELQLDWWGIS